MGKFNEMFPDGLWRMSGTEESFEYTVRGVSTRGRVGVRHLPSGNVRIRLEPAPNIGDTVITWWRKSLPREADYKHPGDGGQQRFSIVVPSGDHADEILSIMFDLLGRKEGLTSFLINPNLADATSTKESLAA